MCVSVHRVWAACQGNLDPDTGACLPEWEETSDEYRYGWERGIGSTSQSFQDGESWKTLAHRLYDHVQTAVADGSGYPGWDQLGPVQRLVWDACVRHLVHLVFWAEGDDPVEDFERRMELWFQEKLLARGLKHERVRPADGDAGGHGLLAA